jgi:hypothetical protein
MGRGEIVKTGVIFAAVIALGAPAIAGAQPTIRATADEQRRHDQISVMEGTLTSSVGLAARQIAREVQSRTPGANLFTGDAHTRGFILDGYGPFFYVEIPALDMSLILTVEALERSAQRRVESPDAQPVGVSQAAREALRSVAVEDPGQRYRDAVKRCLIDAMLDNSKSIDLQPEEWLTIAARGSEAGLVPGEIYQLTTLVLRVKGSVLADFLGGRLTKDEARQKVEVRQF